MANPVTPWTVAPHPPPPRFLCSWDSPGNNTAVGSHSLLQGIFLTQGIEPESLMSPELTDSLPLAPPGKPRKFKVQINKKMDYFFFFNIPTKALLPSAGDGSGSLIYKPKPAPRSISSPQQSESWGINSCLLWVFLRFPLLPSFLSLWPPLHCSRCTGVSQMWVFRKLPQKSRLDQVSSSFCS